MHDIAAQFTVATIQSGKLPAEPVAIADFYKKLVALLEKNDVPASNFPHSNAIKQ